MLLDLVPAVLTDRGAVNGEPENIFAKSETLKETDIETDLIAVERDTS
jgi:hypothetical protein